MLKSSYHSLIVQITTITYFHVKQIPATMAQCSQISIPANHHKSLGMDHSKIKWSSTFSNLPGYVILTLFHPQSMHNQTSETFLAISADKEIRNYDSECSN